MTHQANGAAAGLPADSSAVDRLRAIRALHLYPLPTRGRVIDAVRRAGWTAAFGGLLLFVGFVDGPIFLLLGVPALVFALLYLLRARQLWRGLRTGDPDGGLPTEDGSDIEEGVADVAVGAAVAAASRSLSFLDILSAGNLTLAIFDRFQQRRKAAESVAFATVAAEDLTPRERSLAAAAGIIERRRVPRPVLWLSLGFAGVRSRRRYGVATITDQRLLFHGRYRGGKWRLELDQPLSELAVTEWHEGSRLEERRHEVLVFRATDGTARRIAFPRAWRKEAQAVFELLVSISPNPPPALAAVWHAPRPR